MERRFGNGSGSGTFFFYHGLPGHRVINANNNNGVGEVVHGEKKRTENQDGHGMPCPYKKGRNHPPVERIDPHFWRRNNRPPAPMMTRTMLKTAKAHFVSVKIFATRATPSSRWG